MRPNAFLVIQSCCLLHQLNHLRLWVYWDESVKGNFVVVPKPVDVRLLVKTSVLNQLIEGLNLIIAS